MPRRNRRVCLAGSIVPQYSESMVRDRYVPGEYGSAEGAEVFSQYSIAFDDATEKVDLGDNLDKLKSDTFSVSWWMKESNVAGTRYVMSKRDTSGNLTGWEIRIFPPNYIYFTICCDNAPSDLLDCYCAWADFANWHHYCITYDGSSLVAGVTFYVDGVALTTVSISDTLSGVTSNSKSLAIGAKTGGGTSIDGYMDEVSIWNKELSLVEVNEIYNWGTPIDLADHSAFANCECWLRMGDNDTYPTITDHGSGGTNGTMTYMDAGDIVTEVPCTHGNSYAFRNQLLTCCNNYSFHIGNSLTGDLHPTDLDDLIEQVTPYHEIGYHVRSGWSLAQLYATPGDALVQSAPNDWDQCLHTRPWRAICLQPYGQFATELAAAINFITFSQTAGLNSDSLIYVYATWQGHADQPNQWYDSTPITATSTTRSLLYMQEFSAGIKAAFPAQNVKILPAAGTIHHLAVAILAGEVIGYTAISDLYTDALHLNDKGDYAVASTVAAKLFESPQTDFPLIAGYGAIDAALLTAITAASGAAKADVA